MDAEAFRKAGHELIDFIADYRAQVERMPVQSPHPPNHLRAQLPQEAPEMGEAWERIRADVDALIMPHLFHWQSPNFFGFFPANASYPSILGELLAAGLAQQGMLWMTSPACTELEIVTLDWLAKILVLPDHFLSTGKGGGVIQGTASEAVIVTMVVARTRLVAKLGLTAGDAAARLVAYASESTHSCVAKAAAVLGIRARVLAVDHEQRLRPEALEAAIEADRKAGLLPFFCCATVGTTSTAAADPLPALGRICNAADIWFHIDAAYAGAACIVPELRSHLDGVELADSFNFNPHKFLLVNFDLSALWVRDRAQLISALSITPAYLRNAASEAGTVTDYRDWQLPLGRRFRALKLWFVLRTYGVAGLRAHIRKHMALAARLEAWLKRPESPFEVMFPRNFTLVTFRAKGRDNAFQKAFEDAINYGGRAFLSHTIVQDQYILRASVGTESTEERHIDALCQLLTETYAAHTAKPASTHP